MVVQYHLGKIEPDSLVEQNVSRITMGCRMSTGSAVSESFMTIRSTQLNVSDNVELVESLSFRLFPHESPI